VRNIGKKFPAGGIIFPPGAHGRRPSGTVPFRQGIPAAYPFGAAFGSVLAWAMVKVSQATDTGVNCDGIAVETKGR
jgi:hypothetical protein